MTLSPGREAERIRSRNARPLNSSSSGTVTSCSTSLTDRPSASVCTWTRGAANSGSTSTGACRSAPTATTSSTAAAAARTAASRMLEAMIQRISAPYQFLAIDVRTLRHRGL